MDFLIWRKHNLLIFQDKINSLWLKKVYKMLDILLLLLILLVYDRTYTLYDSLMYF